MIALLFFALAILTSPFKSKRRLEAENAALRQQLTVLRRQVRGRIQLTNNDRLFFAQLYRWFPSVLEVITVIRPETLVRWHRAGFRCYWRWKSRSLGGRCPFRKSDPHVAMVQSRQDGNGGNGTVSLDRSTQRCILVQR